MRTYLRRTDSINVCRFVVRHLYHDFKKKIESYFRVKKGMSIYASFQSLKTNRSLKTLGVSKLHSALITMQIS